MKDLAISAVVIAATLLILTAVAKAAGFNLSSPSFGGLTGSQGA